MKYGFLAGAVFALPVIAGTIFGAMTGNFASAHETAKEFASGMLSGGSFVLGSLVAAHYITYIRSKKRDANDQKQKLDKLLLKTTGKQPSIM